MLDGLEDSDEESIGGYEYKWILFWLSNCITIFKLKFYNELWISEAIWNIDLPWYKTKILVCVCKSILTNI